MSDDQTPPPPAPGSDPGGVPPGTGGPLDDELARRLEALDRLHAGGQITDAELADARRHVLAGDEVASAVARASVASAPVPPELSEPPPAPPPAGDAPAVAASEPPPAPPPAGDAPAVAASEPPPAPPPAEAPPSDEIPPAPPPAESAPAAEGRPPLGLAFLGTRNGMLAGIVGGGIVLALIVLTIVLVAGGGGDGPAPEPDPSGQAPVSPDPDPGSGVEPLPDPEPLEYYDGAVKNGIDRLNASAAAIGTAVAGVSRPRDVVQLGRAARGQIAVVDGVRGQLSQVTVVEPHRQAHQALVAATAEHRRYLAQLTRAGSGTLNQASLAAADAAAQQGRQTQAAYRAFFPLVPAAPDTITAAPLADMTGVKAAIQEAVDAREAEAARREAARAEAERRRREAATPPPSSGGVSGSSFQSPTGNLRCQDQGSELFCSSSNDGFGVWLPVNGSAYTGSGTASGGPVVPYGSAWSSVNFYCESETSGITCYNRSGNGFFLNRDTFRQF